MPTSLLSKAPYPARGRALLLFVSWFVIGDMEIVGTHTMRPQSEWQRKSAGEQCSSRRRVWVFLKSEKCGRGGKIERKKVEKGGKGRESAVFNGGWTKLNAKFCKLAGCWLAKFFCPFWGLKRRIGGWMARRAWSVWKVFKRRLKNTSNKRLNIGVSRFNRR